MEVPRLILSASQPNAMFNPLLRLLRYVVITTSALLLGVACLLFVRRLSGELLQPLTGPALVSVGMLLAVVASLLRMGSSRRARLALLLLPEIAFVLLAFSLSLPGTPLWSLVVFWAVLIGEEGGWWLVTWRSGRLLPQRRTLLPGNATTIDYHRSSPQPTIEQEVELPPEVSQQITRAVQEGDEVLFGRLRCRFESGDRLQSIHVAFCPPLPTAPQMTAHQIEGPSATIKTAEVETYGARLDVRLARTARQESNVAIEFHACTALKNDDAS